ncbi:CHASE2 domain-containing sensor protein [Tibeticola sediminis]|uniref:CHASE2 domain-containing sensor protein n=1 Tax=Tibeticola sediminis TaxID=1917811 RepID=A0A3N4UR16_9BURK|nr:CHASE2 domain-containing protein [Tibeticola sediminis]RPE73136.1 CHASE2 domain-containing sensor protein [Tibeticola sediminis]
MSAAAPARFGRVYASLALLALALALAAGITPLPASRAVDRLWQDQLIRLQTPASAPEELILIDIDERSLQELGPWPWPRPLLAQLAERLRALGVRLQVWDLLLPEPAAGDAALQRQLAAGDIVLGQALVLDPSVQDPPQQGRLQPAADAPPLCSQHAPWRGYLGLAESLAPRAVGHLSATPDPDGRLRRLPAVVCGPAAATGALLRYPQLALAAAAASPADSPWRLEPGQGWLDAPQWLQRGRWRFALDAQGQLSIPYRRPHDQWPALSARLLLQPDAPLPSLQGRIALVGATAVGVGDFMPTPLHPHAPGVSIHAELIAQALRPGAWPGVALPNPGLLAAALTLLGALALGPWWRVVELPYRSGRSRRAPGQPVPAESAAPEPARPAPGAAALIGSALLALALPALLGAWARLQAGLALPLAAPTAAILSLWLALLATQWVAQRRRAQALALLLESFVPPQLARHIAHQAVDSESLGQACQGSLLALRIDGLDAWVARVDSLQALALIHALHSTVQSVAQRYGGTMEHAQGGVLYLGWPGRSMADVDAALACARAVYAELTPLLRQNERPDRPLSAYVALESGSYLLGLVGGPRSRRSVLLGPAANDVAAMLALGPELAVAILVGPAAAQALELGGSAPPLHPLGRFLLPDRPEAQPLWWCTP